MNGKLYAQFVTPVYRDERYVRIEFHDSKTHAFVLGEIHFPNADTDEVFIKFYEPSVEIDALEFISFLQSTVKRLIEERAPKGHRRDEDYTFEDEIPLEDKKK